MFIKIYPLQLQFFYCLSVSNHLPFRLSTVPGSDPYLTSDPVLPPAVGPPACRHGAVSSPAAAVEARSTASAGAGATVTPPTGATAAVHPGTQSLVPAVAAGVVVR